MYTTDEFVDKVNLYGAIPDGRYEPSEIIGIAFDQLQSQVVPLILAMNEEYYVRSESQSITAGTASYDIPYRALGMVLREAKLVLNQDVQDLTRIGPEQVKTTRVGTPTSFYLEALSAVLYPTPDTTQGSLKLSYFQTPATPVLIADAALITAIDRVTGVIAATPPTTWTLTNTFDLVTAKNGHDSKALDLTATAITTTSVTFAAASIPISIVVNDYIALAGQAPYMQCPDLCYRFLVQLTVNELLQAMGATAELAAGRETAGALMQGLVKILSSRVVGAPKPFTIDPDMLR